MANIDSRQFSNFLSLFTELYMCFLANETRRTSEQRPAQHVWWLHAHSTLRTVGSGHLQRSHPELQLWPFIFIHQEAGEARSWQSLSGTCLCISFNILLVISTISGSFYFYENKKKWLKVQQLNKEPLWFIQWISESLDWFKPEKQYRNTVVMLLFSVAKAILC